MAQRASVLRILAGRSFKNWEPGHLKGGFDTLPLSAIALATKEGQVGMSERHGRFQRELSSEEAVYVLRRIDKKYYALEQRFRYVEPSGREFRIPACCESFKTDLASVPAALTWLVPKDGTHTPAALLHDALINDPMKPVDYTGPTIDRVEADKIFREAMAHLGVPFLRRWVMWSAVSLATFMGPRPAPAGRLSHAWRVMRVGAGVLALVATTIGALALWTDLLDLTWADLPAPRLPWMGDRVARWELLGAVALTGIGVLFATGVALLVRGATLLARRPLYLRVRSVSTLVIALAVFCIPALIAGAAWAFFVGIEWLVFKAIQCIRIVPQLGRLLAPANPVRILGRFPGEGLGSSGNSAPGSGGGADPSAGGAGSDW